MDKKKKKLFLRIFRMADGIILNYFKESGIHTHSAIKILTDTGYQGIQKIHPNAELPKKKKEIHKPKKLSKKIVLYPVSVF